MKRLKDKVAEKKSKIPTKIVASFMILIYAITMAVIKERMDAIICIIAVIFCFFGDISLNHKVNHSEQTNRDFIIGLAMFAIAHIFYTISYAVKVEFFYSNIAMKPINWLPFLALDIALILFIDMIIKKYTNISPNYNRIILIYIIIIVTDFSMILFYAVLEKSVNSTAVFGIVFLIISDFLIAFEKFANVKNLVIRKLVWIFYILGQIIVILFA